MERQLHLESRGVNRKGDRFRDLGGITLFANLDTIMQAPIKVDTRSLAVLGPVTN